MSADAHFKEAVRQKLKSNHMFALAPSNYAKQFFRFLVLYRTSTPYAKLNSRAEDRVFLSEVRLSPKETLVKH